MAEYNLVTPLTEDKARDILRSAMPDLSISRIEYCGGGDHSVYAVNDDLLFRFPRQSDSNSATRFVFVI